MSSLFAFVLAIFMAHENGDKQRPVNRRHVQGMLDETDPLKADLHFVKFSQQMEVCTIKGLSHVTFDPDSN